MSAALRSALEDRVVAAVREGRAGARGARERPRAVRHDGAQRRRSAAPGGGAAGVPAPAPAVGRARMTDIWEPEPTGGRPRRAGRLDFAGRPQLAAHLRGARGGRSLLLNGHIDAVSRSRVDRWASHPLRPEIRDGQLYGRGRCDMKGGIAGMLFALETVTRLGAKLAGDVVFCTDTDEESSGAGATRACRHGVRADAGLCAEPTAFDVWVACRGGVNPTVAPWAAPATPRCTTRTGARAGRSTRSRRWRSCSRACARSARSGAAAPSTSTGTCTCPTCCRRWSRGAASWMVAYRLVLRGRALGPVHAGAGRRRAWRSGRLRRGRGVGQGRDRPGRLAGRAPAGGGSGRCASSRRGPGMTTDRDDTLAASADVGRPGRISGLDSWHDAAVFTRVTGTPTVSFGPGDLAKASHHRRVGARDRPRRSRRRGGAHAAALVRPEAVGQVGSAAWAPRPRTLSPRRDTPRARGGL